MVLTRREPPGVVEVAKILRGRVGVTGGGSAGAGTEDVDSGAWVADEGPATG